jgi:hypothetical protein
MRHTNVRFAAILAVCAVALNAAPAVAGGVAHDFKRPNEDGSIPKRWDLPTQTIPSDDSTPTSAGGDGDGVNGLNFTNFADGDMVCAFPGGALTGHAGLWNDRLHVTLTSRCVWSANTTPVNGVQLETPAKYRKYDYAYGIWVPGKYTYGTSVVSWCAAQAGEPYDIMSVKSDYSRWYCSKLAWAGWKVKTGLDLDADGGYWVKPADLVNSAYTRTFAYSD